MAFAREGTSRPLEAAALVWANGRISLKNDVHPDYVECTITCACGNAFATRATKPDIHVEICSSCHPFFTGKQKFVDSEGRVERFRKRYGNLEAASK